MPVKDTMTTTGCLSVAAILCGLLGCAPVAAAPIATGREVIDINGAPMVVFTYRPGGCSDPALLMVFHGELPGVGHSTRKMFSAPQAFEALSP